MMNLTWVAEKASWKFNNGERELFFSPEEISFIEHAMERVGWEASLEEQIDYDSDNLDFSSISRDEFVRLCVDEMQSRWENSDNYGEPDYGGIVFDIAQDNEIWRD